MGVAIKGRTFCALPCSCRSLLKKYGEMLLSLSIILMISFSMSGSAMPMLFPNSPKIYEFLTKEKNVANGQSGNIIKGLFFYYFTLDLTYHSPMLQDWVAFMSQDADMRLRLI